MGVFRYIIISILCCYTIISTSQSFAALASGTVFEIRQNATAGNVNSCGFNPTNVSPGTDYSQQTAAQYNATDLASTNATTNPCVVTSASHNFVAADNGNLIHITAGTNWTAGWYEIVSTAGNAATLDRACGTVASITGGTYYVGGACSMNSTLDDDLFEVGSTAGGFTFWWKYSSTPYTQGELVTISTAANGSPTKPNWMIGYETTRGDLDGVIGGNRPQYRDTGTSGFVLANDWSMRNMYIYSGAATALQTRQNSRIINVKIVNHFATAGRNGISVTGIGNLLTHMDISSSFGNAITSTQPVYLTDSWIHDSRTCFQHTGTWFSVVGNIFSHCGKAVDSFTSTNVAIPEFINNTFVNNITPFGTGFTFITAQGSVLLMNNIFYGFTTAVSMADSGLNANFDIGNLYHNNTTNASNWTISSSSITDKAVRFKDIREVLFSGCTTVATNKLVCSGSDFITSGIVAGDSFFLASGTGTTNNMMYLVASVDSATQITSATALTANATADKAGNFLLGNRFEPSEAVSGRGMVQTHPSGSKNYIDIGAVQRRPGLPRIRVGK